MFKINHSCLKKHLFNIIYNCQNELYLNDKQYTINIIMHYSMNTFVWNSQENLFLINKYPNINYCQQIKIFIHGPSSFFNSFDFYCKILIER